MKTMVLPDFPKRRILHSKNLEFEKRLQEKKFQNKLETEMIRNQIRAANKTRFIRSSVVVNPSDRTDEANTYYKLMFVCLFLSAVLVFLLFVNFG